MILIITFCFVLAKCDINKSINKTAAVVDIKPIKQDDGVHCERSLNMKQRDDKQYRYNPKPLGKKNNRSFIPEEQKTEDYWQRRIKNNVAARKSREDRRRKELETLNRKSTFEKENLQLRLYIQKMQSENQYLVYEINLLREGKNIGRLL